MRIIVSVTSQREEIQTLRDTLASLVKQKPRPYSVEVNLSIEEFPEMENNLPKDLKNFIEENKIIEINWSTKNMHDHDRIIPTIKKYFGSEEYYLLSVKPNFKYKSGYIQTMISFLNKYHTDVFSLTNGEIDGTKTIYFSSCFKEDLWNKLNQQIINNCNNDNYIQKYLQFHWKTIAHFKPDNTDKLVKKIHAEQVETNCKNNTLEIDKVFGFNTIEKQKKPTKLIVNRIRR